MVSVLALGLDPLVADYTAMPNLTPELVQAFIDDQLDRLRNFGYQVESCLVDRGETAEVKVAESLAQRRFDCVVFGAGLRDQAQLLLFEKLLNLVHAKAPQAKICLNTSPVDTAEAVQRWA